MTAEYSEYQGSEEIYSNKAENYAHGLCSTNRQSALSGRVKYERGYIKTGDIGWLAASHSWPRT